ncbi:MAG: hypothetical protein HQ471_07040 [Flavobacteriales bacterium]|jgi:hypothetical protein|nr:hypothetical protein [Flavobacteriales bacterium]
MELASIEILIEKYFEGETSREEEVTLRKFFTTQQVPVHLQEYQDLFGYFEIKRSETFEKKVLPIKKSTSTFRWLSIAASVALLISVFVLKPFDKEPSQEELVQNYQTAQQALDLISKSLNKGTFAMAQLQEFDRTKDIVFKNDNK